MATYSVFWTAHLVHGTEDHVSLHDNTREITVIAVAGDSYICPDANSGPPALDTMSAADHWDGAIILAGTSQTFKLRDEDVPDGALYAGTVSPSSGPSTLSIIAVVN